MPAFRGIVGQLLRLLGAAGERRGRAGDQGESHEGLLHLAHYK